MTGAQVDAAQRTNPGDSPAAPLGDRPATLSRRAQLVFLLLVVVQAAHSLEEYAAGLYQVFAPARWISGLVSTDLAVGFAWLNGAIVLFGLGCYWGPIRGGGSLARPIAWGWVAVEAVNGVLHPSIALATGAYFPGALTAPFLFVGALWLAAEVSQTPLSPSMLAVRFALSPSGAAIDRFCVRRLGHSPVVWLFTRAEGAPYNRPLLLTTTGRTSGEPRSVVLPYFEAGEGAVAIVGSRGGLPSDPHWAKNLRADPEARVFVAREPHAVRARLVDGEERRTLWRSIAERSPIYETYQTRARAHREIPLFVLERVDGARLG
jgi:deazaflavin-dependent oxidoreductase (nitroreductase family)